MCHSKPILIDFSKVTRENFQLASLFFFWNREICSLHLSSSFVAKGLLEHTEADFLLSLVSTGVTI